MSRSIDRRPSSEPARRHARFLPALRGLPAALEAADAEVEAVFVEEVEDNDGDGWGVAEARRRSLRARRHHRQEARAGANVEDARASPIVGRLEGRDRRRERAVKAAIALTLGLDSSIP